MSENKDEATSSEDVQFAGASDLLMNAFSHRMEEQNFDRYDFRSVRCLPSSVNSIKKVDDEPLLNLPEKDMRPFSSRLSPEVSANIFSLMSFYWLGELMALGNSKTLGTRFFFYFVFTFRVG